LGKKYKFIVVSQEQIARDIKMSRENVGIALKLLVEKGCISREMADRKTVYTVKRKRILCKEIQAKGTVGLIN
jgi:predicted transcriptional regulator